LTQKTVKRRKNSKSAQLKPEIGSRVGTHLISSDRARCVFSARRSGTGIPGLGTSGTTTRAAPGKAPFILNRYDVGMDQNLSVSTFGGMMIHQSQLKSLLWSLKSAIS